jgi:hypothetical protein
MSGGSSTARPSSDASLEAGSSSSPDDDALGSADPGGLGAGSSGRGSVRIKANWAWSPRPRASTPPADTWRLKPARSESR